MQNPRIILLSGMGADARVFAKQKEAIPEIEIPEWIEPIDNESLASYAERFAAIINPAEPCIIGGASFGGFVALEMIRHLNPLACFLIGSVRSPTELPASFKALRTVSNTAQFLPFTAATLLSKIALRSGGNYSGGHVKELLTQLSDADASFLRWASQAVLEWDHAIETYQTPIYQIHGERDFVLPVRGTNPDTIVANAGHALSISHPHEVTTFIKHCLSAHRMPRI